MARWFLGSQVAAYSSVFAGEAVLFVVAAVLAGRIAVPALTRTAAPAPVAMEQAHERAGPLSSAHSGAHSAEVVQ